MEPLGLAPDIILGDFDSADSALLSRYADCGAAVRRYPPDKDYTDTELAVSAAVEDGCRKLLIFGAFGARIDHTFTNIQLMFKYALRGVPIVLADCYGISSILTPGKTLFIDKSQPDASLLRLIDPARPLPARPLPAPALSPQPPESPSSPSSPAPPASPFISLLPIGGPAAGVSADGLKYPLCDAALEACYTIGVSNEFARRAATLEIKEGALLVMICADKNT